ncbi:MAG TPA: hypothetical protein VFS00_32160 [Polyangiaceae bacterium]|nr:hypothetical protein [Polyangiaceae bacterium]
MSASAPLARPGPRRPRWPGLARLGPAALGLLGTGCGLQLGGGVANNPRGELRGTASAAVAMNAGRESNGVLGARITSVVDRGLEVRSGALHGGYDFVVAPGWLTLEAGADLGAGSPVNRLYRGVGAYGGLAGGARLRPLGNADRSPQYNILFVTPEIVLAPRAGWWMAPEGAGRGLDFEWGLELALRVVLRSDLAGSSQGLPANDRQSPPPPPPGGAR